MNFDDIAEQLVAARRDGVQADLPVVEGGLSTEDAMAIQNKANAAYGGKRIGWKVGATNEAAQKAFAISAPFFGPMPDSALVENGGAIEKKPTVAACEPEYAFKMARAWPAEGEAVSAETATSAVASVHAAIEVIGRRTGTAAYQNGTGITLDFAGNSQFIVGDEVADWASENLADGVVESMVDGEVVQTGNGQPVMGDPINSLVWLGEQLVAQGDRIEAGEWVSTGTCTPPVPAQAGTTYSAKFADFGNVSVRFT
ncbi:2-keto-4-pentenoate hydratase [Ahrensia sp. R2A130]|uniref:2-keto-4-pentenoate hydratase n=1 Tax=Ahrensia sp. R2A130 TaxID=744979 RepID=UPI0001E0A443|nr:fumarylacetoacetate hydrolase family protein [Ahrensia sp. R2A130]EFL90651.1 putative hydratase [Ahrensia sp. R2A130]